MGLPRVLPWWIASRYLDRVALDLHPAATAMAELAPRHVAIERLAIELEPGREALDDRNQAGSAGTRPPSRTSKSRRERRWTGPRRPGSRVAWRWPPGPRWRGTGRMDRAVARRPTGAGARAGPAPPPARRERDHDRIDDPRPRGRSRAPRRVSTSPRPIPSGRTSAAASRKPPAPAPASSRRGTAPGSQRRNGRATARPTTRAPSGTEPRPKVADRNDAQECDEGRHPVRRRPYR